MNIVLAIVLIVVMTGLGFLVGFFYRKRLIESHIDSLESLGKKILDEARKEAENIKKESRLQAKDHLYQLKQEVEKETQERRQELLMLERRFLQKEENLEKKAGLLDERETDINKKMRQSNTVCI